MDNNYSPLLYFNEDTSLLEDNSSNKVALLDESPVQIYAVQNSLKRKAKAHCDAIIKIISQLSDEVCYLYYWYWHYYVRYTLLHNTEYARSIGSNETSVLYSWNYTIATMDQKVPLHTFFHNISTKHHHHFNNSKQHHKFIIFIPSTTIAAIWEFI